MKKKKHDATVCEPKELLNPSPKVTNCCKSPWVKYSFQKAYMTRLVSSQQVSAMSRNPEKRNLLRSPPESCGFCTDHSPPSQRKENSTGQNHHQEEVIHKMAMQLRNIGDSIDHRMVQEDLQQEGGDALARFVLIFFGGVHVLLRFLWNNHLM